MVRNSAKDVQIRAQSALVDSSVTALREVRVEQAGPVLHLSGRVTSFYHKQLAQELVRSVADGVELVNAIDVE